MWQTSGVAWFGHHIGAVAHEVVLLLIKGGVVRISRGNAGGGACGWRQLVTRYQVFKLVMQNLRKLSHNI